jgi:hypothetical protein
MINWESVVKYLLTHQNRRFPDRAGNICPACKKIMASSDITFQHRAHNAVWRRKKYPLFIDSVFNGAAIHRHCNIYSHRSYGRISDFQAERWERFLARHPRIAKWGNKPEGGLWLIK